MTVEQLVVLLAQIIAWPTLIIARFIPEGNLTVRVPVFILVTWLGWAVSFSILELALRRLAFEVSFRAKRHGGSPSLDRAERRARTMFDLWRFLVAATGAVSLTGGMRIGPGYSTPRSNFDDFSRTPTVRQRLAMAALRIGHALIAFVRLLFAAIGSPRLVVVSAAAVWLAFGTPGVDQVPQLRGWLMTMISQITPAQIVTGGALAALFTGLFWSAKFRGRIAWRRDQFRSAYERLEETGLAIRAALHRLYKVQEYVDGALRRILAGSVESATADQFTAHGDQVVLNLHRSVRFSPPEALRPSAENVVRTISQLTVPDLPPGISPKETPSPPEAIREALSSYEQSLQQTSEQYAAFDQPGMYELRQVTPLAARQVLRDGHALPREFGNPTAWSAQAAYDLRHAIVWQAKRHIDDLPEEGGFDEAAWESARDGLQATCQSEVERWIDRYRDALATVLWRSVSLSWASYALLKLGRPTGLRGLVEHLTGRSA